MGVFNFLNKGIRGFLGREMGGGSRGITQQRLQTQAGKSGGGRGVLGGGGSGAGFKGNRGIRAVSIEQPNLTGEIPSGVTPYATRVANSLVTPEGIEVPVNEVNNFLYGGEWLFVTSSNVAAARYDAANNILTIQFHDAAYAYSDVSMAEATEFVTSQSKGKFVWDVLRVRGSKTKHKKPFAKVGGGLATRHQPGQYGGANPLG